MPPDAGCLRLFRMLRLKAFTKIEFYLCEQEDGDTAFLFLPVLPDLNA